MAVSCAVKNSMTTGIPSRGFSDSAPYRGHYLVATRHRLAIVAESARERGVARDVGAAKALGRRPHVAQLRLIEWSFSSADRMASRSRTAVSESMPDSDGPGRQFRSLVRARRKAAAVSPALSSCSFRLVTCCRFRNTVKTGRTAVRQRELGERLCIRQVLDGLSHRW